MACSTRKSLNMSNIGIGQKGASKLVKMVSTPGGATPFASLSELDIS